MWQWLREGDRPSPMSNAGPARSKGTGAGRSTARAPGPHHHPAVRQAQDPAGDDPQQAPGSGEPLRFLRRTRGARGTRSRGEAQGEVLSSHESTSAFGPVKRNYPSRRGVLSQDLGVLLYAGEALVERWPRMARPDQAANYAAGVLVA